MVVTAETYEELVLRDRAGHWELVRGELRRKPPVTSAHSNAIESLTIQTVRQIDEREYAIRVHDGRLRVSTGSCDEPDFAILPWRLAACLLATPTSFEVFDAPVPFVVEVWSPSAGAYDRDTKLAEYRLRGDQEIWLLHPYNRTVTIWRLTNAAASTPERQYTETVITAGPVPLFAVPSVVIDIDRLFP